MARRETLLFEWDDSNDSSVPFKAIDLSNSPSPMNISGEYSRSGLRSVRCESTLVAWRTSSDLLDVLVVPLFPTAPQLAKSRVIFRLPGPVVPSPFICEADDGSGFTVFAATEASTIHRIDVTWAAVECPRCDTMTAPAGAPKWIGGAGRGAIAVMTERGTCWVTRVGGEMAVEERWELVGKPEETSRWFARKQVPPEKQIVACCELPEGARCRGTRVELVTLTRGLELKVWGLREKGLLDSVWDVQLAGQMDECKPADFSSTFLRPMTEGQICNGVVLSCLLKSAERNTVVSAVRFPTEELVQDHAVLSEVLSTKGSEVVDLVSHSGNVWCLCRDSPRTTDRDPDAPLPWGSVRFAKFDPRLPLDKRPAPIITWRTVSCHGAASDYKTEPWHALGPGETSTRVLDFAIEDACKCVPGFNVRGPADLVLKTILESAAFPQAVQQSFLGKIRERSFKECAPMSFCQFDELLCVARAGGVWVIRKQDSFEQMVTSGSTLGHKVSSLVAAGLELAQRLEVTTADFAPSSLQFFDSNVQQLFLRGTPEGKQPINELLRSFSTDDVVSLLEFLETDIGQPSAMVIDGQPSVFTPKRDLSRFLVNWCWQSYQSRYLVSRALLTCLLADVYVSRDSAQLEGLVPRARRVHKTLWALLWALRARHVAENSQIPQVVACACASRVRKPLSEDSLVASVSSLASELDVSSSEASALRFAGLLLTCELFERVAELDTLCGCADGSRSLAYMRGRALCHLSRFEEALHCLVKAANGSEGGVQALLDGSVSPSLCHKCCSDVAGEKSAYVALECAIAGIITTAQDGKELRVIAELWEIAASRAMEDHKWDEAYLFSLSNPDLERARQSVQRLVVQCLLLKAVPESNLLHRAFPGYVGQVSDTIKEQARMQDVSGNEDNNYYLILRDWYVVRNDARSAAEAMWELGQSLGLKSLNRSMLERQSAAFKSAQALLKEVKKDKAPIAWVRSAAGVASLKDVEQACALADARVALAEKEKPESIVNMGSVEKTVELLCNDDMHAKALELIDAFDLSAAQFFRSLVRHDRHLEISKYFDTRVANKKATLGEAKAAAEELLKSKKALPSCLSSHLRAQCPSFFSKLLLANGKAIEAAYEVTLVLGQDLPTEAKAACLEGANALLALPDDRLDPVTKAMVLKAVNDFVAA